MQGLQFAARVEHVGQADPSARIRGFDRLLGIDGALHDEKVKATLAEMGAVVKGGSPDDFKNWIASETVKWTKIIKTANIKGE